MQAEESSIHNRSYSFSKWQNNENDIQYPTRFYYNYPQRNENIRNERMQKIAMRDMPTFGDGMNGRKGQGFYVRSKSISKVQQSKNCQEEQGFKTKAAFNAGDDFCNRGNSRQSWGQKKNYNNYQTSLGQSRGCRVEVEKANESKFSNIDKINLKIKKILDTLNEEQRKIAQNHLRAGSKKTSIHPYATKIRNEHSGNYTDEYNRKNQQNSDVVVNNLYSKLVDIRERHKNSCDDDQPKNVLGEIRVNSRDKVRKISDFVLPEQRPFKSYGVEQSSQGSYYKQRKSTNQLPKGDYTCCKNEGSYKNSLQTSYPLLKGTNAKSTDSLGVISSSNLKSQKQYKNERPIREHHRYFTSEQNSQQKYPPTQQQFENNSYLRCKQYGYNNNFRGENQKQKQTHQLKTQPSFYRVSEKVDGRQDITPTFSSFGQSRSKKIENTPQRSYSHIKHQKSQKSCTLSNGKNLDAEIERIQRKIQDFNAIKKELGVEDKQNSKYVREVESRSGSKFRQSKQSSHQGEKQARNSFDKCYQLTSHGQLSKIAQFNTGSNNSECTLRPQENENQNQKINEIQGTCKDDIEVSLPKPFKMSSRKTTKRINNSTIKQIQSAFISQDRFSQQNRTLQSLISNICKQIELDTNLRNSKKWFSRKASPFKWMELTKELATREIHTSEQQNKQIFTMSQEQDNPFYTTRDDEGSYNQLIDHFLTSEKFWIGNLQHKYSKIQIETSIKEIDIQKKGIIMIEDMVRFINFESDKYYRNRDLSLIFRRLSGVKGQVTTQYILAQFCRL